MVAGRAVIAIRRAAEPSWLSAVRNREVARVEAALASDPTAKPPKAPEALTSDLVGEAYRPADKDLWRMQHRKCCYCESPIPTSFNDVEHYRPKARVTQRKGGNPEPGYWWLAWTWENLLYACPGCNRSAKNDQFPLGPAGKRLSPKQPPSGQEDPLLIDPSAPGAHPEPHFRFTVTGRARGHVAGVSPEGVATVEVCALHRDELIELRAAVLDVVESGLGAVSVHLGAGQLALAVAAWQVVLTQLDPASSFASLRRQRIAEFWRGLTPQQQQALPRPPDRVA
jgi:uncharacterized protein (TIGR02646 family)